METVSTSINPIKTSLPVLDFSQSFQYIGEWLVAHYPSFVVFVKSSVGLLVGLSIPLSVALLLGIIFCVEKLKTIRRKEHEIFDLKVENSYETVIAGDADLAKRWENVQRHIESNNSNDWRQAIMEADIMLDDLLNKMEYKGDSIGEKLKRVEKSDFETLDSAWEAHKFRNQIAHEGSAMEVNQYEAKRVINLYKKVFEEFYYI
jgi:hypothetical protein